MINKPARMGQYVRQHKPVFNRHTIIHSFRRNHFAFPQQAIITQQKRIPDVSFWQGIIDWDKMRTKTDAVIIRAGQGYWGTDTQWLRNWSEAKQRGMLRSCYWFYDDRESPHAQAAKLVKLIENDHPSMEVVIDWETYYGGSYGGLREVVAMMQEVERLAPWAKLAFYSGFYWFTGNTNPITHASQYNYLKSKALWLAWYTNDATLVKIPAPWGALWMWQFGTPAVGLEYGVRTAELDMNFFSGTEAEFYARYGIVTPPPTNGETMNLIVNTAYLNGRATPNGSINFPAGSTLSTGFRRDDKLESPEYVVDSNGITKWYRITRCVRNGTDVTLPATVWASDGGTAQYLLVDTTVPPPITVTSIDITLAAGSVVTRKYSDGTEEREVA